MHCPTRFTRAFCNASRLKAKKSKLIPGLPSGVSDSESDRSMRNVLNEIIPPDTRKHMRAAWREELLAVRSVLDHWIEKQDENVSGAKRRESIRVD